MAVSASTRVPVQEAKQILDQLLSRFTKRYVSRLTGVSIPTLTKIDMLSVQHVDGSTVGILKRYAAMYEERYDPVETFVDTAEKGPK